MSRSRLPKRVKGNYVATTMFKLTPADLEYLHQEPLMCYERIRAGARLDPGWFRVVKIRLHYMYHASKNFEEETFLRILSLLALERVTRLFNQFKETGRCEATEEDDKLIKEALNWPRQYDEAITRIAIKNYYVHASRVLSREPLFRDIATH